MARDYVITLATKDHRHHLQRVAEEYRMRWLRYMRIYTCIRNLESRLLGVSNPGIRILLLPQNILRGWRKIGFPEDPSRRAPIPMLRWLKIILHMLDSVPLRVEAYIYNGRDALTESPPPVPQHGRTSINIPDEAVMGK